MHTAGVKAASLMAKGLVLNQQNPPIRVSHAPRWTHAFQGSDMGFSRDRRNSRWLIDLSHLAVCVTNSGWI